MFTRISIYINEMFPLPAILGSIIAAVAVQLVYLKLHGISGVPILKVLVPGLVLTFISLLLRIMDEFKDFQDDLTNFPERPLPSGRVLKSDLSKLAIFCILAVLFLSTVSMTLLLWAIVILIFTGLMFKWFFMETSMRKSLPLAFISHHPIVVLNFIYLILACNQIDPRVEWDYWIYVLPICLIYTNWELVRKIRAPEQETVYTTYSKILGPRTAIFISFGLQLIYNSAVFAIFSKLETHMIVRIVYSIVQLVLIFPSLKFALNLKLKASLRPNAEGQILMVVGFLMVAALL